MGQQTPLYDQHVDAGARIVDFGGWDMPLHYGSQLEEHHAVRREAGMFDVSHMTVVDITGSGARDYLRYLLANDVAKLQASGKALYSCMLNEDGGIVDDLIVYRLDDASYRMVVNAATREQDVAWMTCHAQGRDVTLHERDELAMIAVQGPAARERAAPALDAAVRDGALDLKPFHALAHDEWFVARTGYTGEDGWEIVLPAGRAARLWNELAAAGVQPCGLGARDTLRLEAGMNLYGTDMDPSWSPLASGLAWTVAWAPEDRDFVGRAALTAERDGPARWRFTGLLLEGRGVLRNHLRVIVDGRGEGEITSGGFAPTLNRSIAMARLPAGDYDRAQAELRGRFLDVRLVRLPFVRNGTICIDV
ncbi:MAG: glycine cleavage system aminomethyltransferase GcvT [Woeseiaceae bacterium]|nr:glycine cleavage system aminomethyltransferase GcvT [Woeseiaceae bacterium]